MFKPVNIIGPKDYLDAIKAKTPAEEILWGDSEPMRSPLNPLDDPLGAIPIDYYCHIATVLFQTGTAGIVFASAVIDLVRKLGKPIQIRDAKTDKNLITVSPETDAKQIEEAISDDSDTST